MNSFSLYQLAIKRDEDETDGGDVLPRYCLRRALWDHQKDAMQYHQAKNKKQYIEGDQQIDAISTFITASMYPELFTLVEDLRQLAQKGFVLEPVQRTDTLWRAVQVRLEAILFSTHLDYGLNTYQNQELESWLTRWYNVCSRLDFTTGIMPEKDFFVTYPFSLREAIALFPE